MKQQLPIAIAQASSSNVLTNGEAITISWGDGKTSTLSSTWLRGACRESHFLHPETLLPTKAHSKFRAKPSMPILQSEVSENGDIVVKWDDHTAYFNPKYLRAHVMMAAEQREASELILPRQLWKKDEIEIPTFQYEFLADQSQQLNWMRKFLHAGAMIVEGVDKSVSDKGLVDVYSTIGPIKQRYHPTRCFMAEWPGREDTQAHEMAYDTDLLRLHSDTPYYETPARLVGFTVPVYESPTEDIPTFMCDGFRVVEDLKQKDPDAYKALTETPVLWGRRRYKVEEECSEEERRMLEWDASTVRTPIQIDELGRVQRVHVNRNHYFQLGNSMLSEAEAQEFERAYQLYMSMCDSPEYQQAVVIKPGMALICDNWRIHHGRHSIPSDAHRILFGAFMSDEIVRSRWRFEVSKETGLEDRWLVGCPDELIYGMAYLNLQEQTVGKEAMLV